ncbi:MAG TPA: methionine--tRNA ligase [Coleofasciculaceae cyanobacterium]|jgi:methionyl-tRNA synthetase
MSEKNTYYITTAIDYVNAAPHLGHAYEKIATDVMARFQRLLGREVFFLTGTDEHGTKVEKTAKARGITPREHTDELVEEFKKAWQYLNLTYDRFIRTTDADHYAVVEHLWRTLAAKGDIEKRSYQGLYCSGCEKFMTERDLNEAGECPFHDRKPELVEEENYFFKLSKYKDAIAEHIRKNPDFVLPEFRAEEVLKMLEDVEDISVSRHRDSVSWGIPVPDDAEQVIYVWIDALSNYITGVGYRKDDALFHKFWPADVHMIGKDILRFHAIYWPAMLMSANIPLPRQIFAHGFININDAKISKSVGNVVSPFTLRERFDLPNPDPIRYYLMTVATFGQDGGFTEDDFKLKVNADLANNLGNLLNRTLNMTNKYFEGQVPASGHARPGVLHAEGVDEVRQAYESYDFQKAAELILQLVDWANKEINDKEPWTLAKEGKTQELSDLMYTVLETLRQVAIMLSPITPTLSDEIWTQLGYPATLSVLDPRWSDISSANIPPGQRINLQGPILPRLDSELAGASKKK